MLFRSSFADLSRINKSGSIAIVLLHIFVTEGILLYGRI